MKWLGVSATYLKRINFVPQNMCCRFCGKQCTGRALLLLLSLPQGGWGSCWPDGRQINHILHSFFVIMLPMLLIYVFFLLCVFSLHRSSLLMISMSSNISFAFFQLVLNDSAWVYFSVPRIIVAQQKNGEVIWHTWTLLLNILDPIIFEINDQLPILQN